MRKFILPFGNLMIVIIVLGVLFGAQAVAARVIQDRTGAREVSCEPIQIVNVTEEGWNAGSVGLKMICDGKEVVIIDPAVIASWANNSGPIKCTIYTGRVICQPRPSR